MKDSEMVNGFYMKMVSLLRKELHIDKRTYKL